jgi:hypothetical protein
MNHSYPRLLAKEEYDKLIKELQECSNLFFIRFTEYKEMIKINPRVYNETSDDLQIYYDVLSEIKLDELLEKQYQTTINISNQFENEYAALQMEVDELLYINLKYNNINCAERKREIVEFYDTLLYGPN